MGCWATALAQKPLNIYEQAQQLLDAGKGTQALVVVDEWLTRRPDDAHVRFLKGRLLDQTGQTAQAIQVYTELTRDFPELSEPYNNLAVIYSANNQPELARSALEMALKNNPKYALAHDNLGDVYLQLALRSYQKALDSNANNGALKAKILTVQTVLKTTP